MKCVCTGEGCQFCAAVIKCTANPVKLSFTIAMYHIAACELKTANQFQGSKIFHDRCMYIPAGKITYMQNIHTLPTISCPGVKGTSAICFATAVGDLRIYHHTLAMILYMQLCRWGFFLLICLFFVLFCFLMQAT